MAHEHKFDPSRAHVLDAPEPETYLPTQTLVALLDLQGGERVLDYGAGTGRPSIAVDEAGGELAAAGLRPEMVATHLPFHYVILAHKE